MAEIFNKLMTENLGIKITLHKVVIGEQLLQTGLVMIIPSFVKQFILIVLTMRHPDGPQSYEEKEWQTRFDKDQIMQDGYRTQQATKPQTLSYGMMDSPVGIAAWIIEKMYSWSDLKDNKIESVYSKDKLLANIMVYVLTKPLIQLLGFIMEEEKRVAFFSTKILKR